MMPRRVSIWRLLFLLASLGGQGLALSAVITMAGLLAFSLVQGDSESAGFAAWSAASSFGILLALLPGTFWALRGVLGRPDPAPVPLPAVWRVAWVLLPLGLLLGGLAFYQNGPALTLTVAPVAHIMTSLSVAVLLVGLATRRGPIVPAHQAAAAFSTGLTVIPFLAIIAEFGFLLPLVVTGGVLLVASREGSEMLRSLMASGGDPTALDPNTVAEWMARPAIVAGVYGFIAGIVPCVEEIAKTAAVWRFLRRGLSGAEAFLIGALAGAGYGLFESLFLSQPGPDWLGTAMGRVGASFMHAATAGITSWGLMEWARRRRWERALGTYAVAVLAHATWNAAALTTGYSELMRSTSSTSAAGLSPVGLAANLVLVALSLGAWAVLVLRRPKDDTVERSMPSA